LIRLSGLSCPRHAEVAACKFASGAGIRGQPDALTLGAALWHNSFLAAVGRGGQHWDGMKNGLYSIHVTLLDGRTGKGSGVILFRDGQILGGDAYLFYTGSYTVKGDTFKGEVLVQRHTTPRDNDNPLFGGPNPVGIGVSGTFTDTRGTMNGTALVGKASQIFGATLHKLADAT
jgi:T3SS negative regulator,GrlR